MVHLIVAWICMGVCGINPTVEATFSNFELTQAETESYYAPLLYKPLVPNRETLKYACFFKFSTEYGRYFVKWIGGRFIDPDATHQTDAFQVSVYSGDEITGPTTKYSQIRVNTGKTLFDPSKIVTLEPSLNQAIGADIGIFVVIEPLGSDSSPLIIMEDLANAAASGKTYTSSGKSWIFRSSTNSWQPLSSSGYGTGDLAIYLRGQFVEKDTDVHPTSWQALKETFFK
jgi:hypothetical protein